MTFAAMPLSLQHYQQSDKTIFDRFRATLTSKLHSDKVNLSIPALSSGVGEEFKSLDFGHMKLEDRGSSS